MARNLVSALRKRKRPPGEDPAGVSSKDQREGGVADPLNSETSRAAGDFVDFPTGDAEVSQFAVAEAVKLAQ